MLILGEYYLVDRYILDNFKVYNLTSMREDVPRLSIFPYISANQYIDDKGFDMYLYNYILGNDEIFYNFMKYIMYDLYMGENVFLLISRGFIFDLLSTSLLKLIQQRYGYNGAIVNTYEDIFYVKEGFFTAPGVTMLDVDKNRFSLMRFKKDDLDMMEKNNV